MSDLNYQDNISASSSLAICLTLNARIENIPGLMISQDLVLEQLVLTLEKLGLKIQAFSGQLNLYTVEDSSPLNKR